MLAIAAVALTAGSVTVAVVAPFNLLLAVALGPVAGTGAAVLAAVVAVGRQEEDEQDGAERDVETDRMVSVLRDMTWWVAGSVRSPNVGIPGSPAA